MSYIPVESFPPGTPVRVREVTLRRGQPIEVETIGVVEEWDRLPTGSWYAHGKNTKVWLDRLKIRKVDGELSLIVIDDGASIARLEPAASS
jgi:hypothetical protein